MTDEPAPPPAATLSDFPELQYLSDLSDLALGPVEAHGIYCGLLCSGEREPIERWLDEILPQRNDSGTDTASCREALSRLAEQTRDHIQSPELGFSPLLPASDTALAERAEAVHDWSRGFLYGLGLTGCDPNTFSGATREALDDLTELTRLDLDDLEDSEQNEESLMELTEFLWVAAMLVYEDRGRQSGAPTQARRLDS